MSNILLTRVLPRVQQVRQSDDHTRARGFVAKSEDGGRLSFNVNGRFILPTRRILDTPLAIKYESILMWNSLLSCIRECRLKSSLPWKRRTFELVRSCWEIFRRPTTPGREISRTHLTYKKDAGRIKFSQLSIVYSMDSCLIGAGKGATGGVNLGERVGKCRGGIGKKYTILHNFRVIFCNRERAKTGAQ